MTDVLGLGKAYARPADTLRVYDCTAAGHSLKRYGRAHDGGYIIASGLDYDHFLSGGIADDNSFERDVLDLHENLTCDAYDPNSDGHTPHPRIRFHREPLGYEGLDRCKNALVKLDIERAEWPWLYHFSVTWWPNVAQLVMELHSPHVPESGWSWDSLEIINRTHVLIHAHGNNFDGIVEAGGARIPGTLECTWLRRDLCVLDLPRFRGPIPGPLDMPNDQKQPDHVIDWEPFVWKEND